MIPNKKKIESDDKDELDDVIEELCDMTGLDEIELEDLLDDCDMDLEDFLDLL